MPTDTPSALLVWRESTGNYEGFEAEAPFGAFYRIENLDPPGWDAYFDGPDTMKDGVGALLAEHLDEAAALAACEADYARRCRAAGLVPAGENERLREALRCISDVRPHPATALDFRCQSIALGALAGHLLAPTPAAPAGSDNAVADLVREAIRFADWAAGEGIMPEAGEAARVPEGFLMDYRSATGDEDWSTLADRIAAMIRSADAIRAEIAWLNDAAATCDAMDEGLAAMKLSEAASRLSALLPKPTQEEQAE